MFQNKPSNTLNGSHHEKTPLPDPVPLQMPGQPQVPAVAGVQPSVVAPPVKEVKNVAGLKV